MGELYTGRGSCGVRVERDPTTHIGPRPVAGSAGTGRRWAKIPDRPPDRFYFEVRKPIHDGKTQQASYKQLREHKAINKTKQLTNR